MAAAVLAARLGLIAAGYPLKAGMDWSLTGAVLLGAAGLRLGARVWLVRGGGEELREQIRYACRGLFLECEEPEQGRFAFCAKGMRRHLRTLALGRRLQLVVLPRPGGHAKITLLTQWLSKQYPGPIPRMRRVLKRREA